MRRSAAMGGGVWLACAVAAWCGRGPFWIIELLFLLAPLVLVPLALDAIGVHLGLAQPIAALGAAVSFLPRRGLTAGLLAGAWLLLTVLVAWRGFDRLLRQGRRNAAELAIDAGMMLLPVGGGWLVLSRLGATPLGFEEPIVLLTAVHFHYAAFTTLVLIGLAGRLAGESRVYRAIVTGALLGTPLLAAGITFSRAIELAGAVLLAGALWTFAGYGLLRVVPRLAGQGARLLLTLSFLSLLPSMLLAALYAWGRLTGRPVVALADLAAIHAPLNAFGFGLCGLLGWQVASPWPAVPVHDDRRQK